MKSFAGVLLAWAMCLPVAAGALAAELPFRKAAEGAAAATVCDQRHHPGFVYIPATDTCVRIGGSVTYEYRMRR